MIREYDDYGPIPETKSLVDTFVTIDLHRKQQVFENQKHSILIENHRNSAGFDSVLKRCKDLGEKYEIHPDIVLILLGECKWDDNIFEDLWAQNAPTLLARIGIPYDQRNQDPGLRNITEDGFCEICCEERKKEDLWALPCGHYLCTQCWTDLIKTEVEHGNCLIKCQTNKCNCRLPVTSICKFCSKKVYENLINFVTDLQISISSDLRQCPNPKCGKPLTVVGCGARYCNTMKCSYCNTEFCIKCFANCHAPATCSQVERWGLVTNDDLMERRCLNKDRKRCPHCHYIIEKNDGCNHMTCFKCKHEFCWVCLRDWEHHTKNYYNCTEQMTPEAQQYLIAPDDINPKLLEEYNDIFLKSRLLADTYLQRQEQLIDMIKDRIARESGTDPEQIMQTIKNIIDQIIWANRNVEWAAVVLFFDRFDQLKKLNVTLEEQYNNPKKYSIRYNLVRNAMNNLMNDISQVDKIVENAKSSTIPNLKLRDFSKLYIRLKLSRDVLLKQCDPLYQNFK